MSGFSPRVLPVGDRAVTVVLGDSLDEATIGRVRALDDRLRDASIPGVLESIPTYAALMVIYDRAELAFTELEARLRDLARNLPSSGSPGRLVTIPAVYDGEDLEEVATLSGLSTADVSELHAGRDYSVLMLGFSPGFAYMGFVDERLRLPRRQTPRTRVPAGAIAIAGPQTGIYPRRLPGGWNLLGRTNTRLFDPAEDRPSLLMPGDRVRFARTEVLGDPPSVPETEIVGSGVTVLEPGMFTTIQDAGRPGLRRIAVPLAGFVDCRAARHANLCVGNPPENPAIELCGPGLRLRFDRTTYIVLSGARLSAVLDRSDLDGRGMEVPMGVAIRVRPSNVLIIHSLGDGARGYVGIAGLDAPRVLGSASVDAGSGFLRPLQAGDSLTVGTFDAERVRRDPEKPAARPNRVRVILGPQADHFDEAAVSAFLSADWRVGLDSDRTGARLNGLRLSHAGPKEIVSDGMVPGCIQVPPDGRPIVMLADCPTTGGYPKIACVVSEDLDIIAQAVPDATPFRFEAVRVENLEPS